MADSVKIRIDGDDSGFKKSLSNIGTTASKALTGVGVAVLAVGAAFVKGVKDVSDYGSEVNDMSQKMNLATDTYQKWSYIFKQNGSDISVMQMGMKTLSNAVVDGSKAFDKLGVSLEDARAMSPEELFEVSIQKLAEMEDGADRTALAVDLFGKSATELLPVLNSGADGIAQMKKEAELYGLIMSGDAVAASDAFGDALELAKQTMSGARNFVIANFLPAMTRGVTSFTKFASSIRDAFGSGGIDGVFRALLTKTPLVTSVITGLAAAFAAMAIIGTVNAIMDGFLATTNALRIATQYGTIAQWLDLGALSAKQIVVALLTKQIGFATAAQALFNRVMAANPVLLLAAAIGVLVGGTLLLQGVIRKTNPEFYALSDATKEAADQVKSLNGQAEESKKAFEESNVEIEKQALTANTLVNSLVELSAAYGGSSIEQAKMDGIISKLNSSVPGLTIEYNKQTGALNMTEDAIRDVIKAQAESAKAAAAIKRNTELLEEQANAEYALWVAKKAYNDVVATGADKNSAIMRRAAKTMRDAETAYNDAGVAVADYNTWLDESGVVTDATMQATDDLATSLEEIPAVVEPVIIAGYDLTDSLDDIGMTADEVAGRLDGFSGAAQNMFEKISTESSIKVGEMIDNLESNAIAIEDWGDNIAYLGGKLPSDLLQPLIDAGPSEMAGALSELAGASDEELANLSEAFRKGGDEAKEAWLLSLGAGVDGETVNLAEQAANAVTNDTTLDAAVAQAVTDAKTIMVETVASTDFGQVGSDMAAAANVGLSGALTAFTTSGKNLVNGFIVGMLARKKAAQDAAIVLALAANAAFNAALKINSPSKLTMKSGASFVEGFVKGISNSYNDMQGAVSAMALTAVGGFNNNLASRSFDTYGGGTVSAGGVGGINQTNIFNVPVISPNGVMNRLKSEQVATIYG